MAVQDISDVADIKSLQNMKSVIYKMNSYTVVRVVTGDVSFNDLKDDEDFILLSLWNEGAESLGYPKIEE